MLGESVGWAQPSSIKTRRLWRSGGRGLAFTVSATPGREDEEIAVATTLTREERPYQIIEAVGGFDNIEDVDACATRLRLALVDDKKVNEKRLKELGAAGLVKLGDGGVQVIFGGKSQILRDEIKTVMSRPRPTEMTVACAN